MLGRAEILFAWESEEITLELIPSQSNRIIQSTLWPINTQSNIFQPSVIETGKAVINKLGLQSKAHCSVGGECQDLGILSEIEGVDVDERIDPGEGRKKVQKNGINLNYLDVETLLKKIDDTERKIDDGKLLFPLHVNRYSYETHEELYKAVRDWWVTVKGKSEATITHRITYARAMARHPIYPVNWFEFVPEQILNLVMHKQIIEYPKRAKETGNPNYGISQLHHDIKTIRTFASCFDINISSWGWSPPSIPEPQVKIVPRPRTVNKLLHHKYSTDRYTTALVRTLLTVGFHSGMRPEEIIILKEKNVKFDEGYILIAEQKKRFRERQIWLDPPVMHSRQLSSLKNWCEIWRPRSPPNDLSKGLLFIQKNGKPFPNENAFRMFLNRHCKPVWNDFTPKIMRDWCAIAKLIRTKIETKRWDTRIVKYALGHKNEKTTDMYTKFAENYYRNDPYDWLRAVLKFHPNSKRMKRLMEQQNGPSQEISEILEKSQKSTNGQKKPSAVKVSSVGKNGPEEI